MGLITRKSVLIALLLVGGFAGTIESQSQPINLYEPETWERPVLIAHRGGVITDSSSANSAAAVRLAAEWGFAMVEVDVRESKDSVPVAFHDDNMLDDTGTDAKIEDLDLEEIKTMRYRDTDQKILTLNQYLDLCAQHELGVMLDIKTDGSKRFFRRIATLIDRYQLDRSAVTISDHPMAIQYLRERAMLPITNEKVQGVKEGRVRSLEGKFWFGLPKEIRSETVKQLQDHGALVIPAINKIRYPGPKHMQLAKEDVVRMRNAGVDAYQIDAVYVNLFRTSR